MNVVHLIADLSCKKHICWIHFKYDLSLYKKFNRLLVFMQATYFITKKYVIFVILTKEQPRNEEFSFNISYSPE